MAAHAYVSVPLSAPHYFSPRPCLSEGRVDRIAVEGEYDQSPSSSTSSSPSAYSPSFVIPMPDTSSPHPQAAVRILPRTRLSLAGSAVSLVVPSLSPTTLLIVLYFTLNLTLTFYNKSLLNNFPFPYFITSLHAASGVIGCACLRLAGVQFANVATDSSPSSAHKRSSYSQLPTEEKDASSAQEPLLSSSSSSSSVSSACSQGEANGPKERSSGRTVVVLLYSTLYAANIAMSNASLSLVSVPFHQIVRSTCPLFTLTLSYVLLSKSSFSQRSTVALLPIVWGAALSCIGGTIRYTRWGVILTVFGTFLAALKTVTTNLLQGGGKGNASTADASASNRREDDPHQKQALASQSQGLLSQYSFQYSALELLEVMSPLACIQCLAASYFSGELQLALQHLYLVDEGVLDMTKIASLVGNGAIAFLLNVVSFKTNRAAGPLTMTVVGNVKQVVTILLALYLYRLSLAPINAFGIFVALLGTVWYGAEEVRAKKLRSAVNSG